MKKDIVEYCVENPDEIVEDIMKKFNVPQSTAFYAICEAAKKLK